MNITSDITIRKREKCPCCKSGNNQILYSNPFDKPPVSGYLSSYYEQNNLDFSFLNGVIFEIRKCETCGLIYHTNVLSDNMMSIFYDEWMTQVRESEVRYNKNYYINMSREIEKILGAYTYSGSLIKVLDFGAGWGHWSMMAKAFGAEASALELSEEKKAYLRRQGINIVDINNLPQNEYDIINTEQVFEHLPEPKEILSLLCASLKPGGIIKISVPDGSNVQQNLSNADWFAERYGRRSLMPIQPLEHINCFNLKSLEYLARLNNLSPVNFITGIRPILELRILDLAGPLYRFLFRKRDPIMRTYFRKPGTT
jgi:2-polyprenyl-3-methyl-5-hydroxy-6-metoxy-1,4-benzoquinol methylase